MKKLLAVFLLLTSSLLGANSYKAQETRLYKELARESAQFGLTGIWIDIKVVSTDKMRDHGAWGDTYFDGVGAHIEIIPLEEMEPGRRNKKAFQTHILQHEVLHIYMTKRGIMQEVQDTIIDVFQPQLARKK